MRSKIQYNKSLIILAYYVIFRLNKGCMWHTLVDWFLEHPYSAIVFWITETTVSQTGGKLKLTTPNENSLAWFYLKINSQITLFPLEIVVMLVAIRN